MSQSAFSEVVSLYCQGRYQTGELLQLRLDMDFDKNVLIADNKTTPLIIDDFNIMWSTFVSSKIWIQHISSIMIWTISWNKYTIIINT